MANSESSSISGWYETCQPLFIDLVGDYAGKELFLVEGDSLLRECFEDERIDFHDGFQMLHAVFVVERFLENLIKRHCRFHIAFFDENRELCVPPGANKDQRHRYMLARSVVIRHLLVHLPDSCPDVQVEIFPSLGSDEFHKYLEASPVYFVMAHDGSLPATGTATTESSTEQRSKILLRSNIWWFNSHGLNVALINRIEFRDSKVFTAILGGIHQVRHSNRFDAETTEVWGNFINENASVSAKGFNPPTESDINSWLTNPYVTDLLVLDNSERIASESWYLTICAISLMINGHNASPLASAFVLHSILLKNLALSQRRLPLVEFQAEAEDTVTNFLAVFTQTAKAVLNDKGWIEAMRDNEVDLDLADLVDGRLFRVAIELLSKDAFESLLPKAVKEDWNVASKVIQSITGAALNLDAIPGMEILEAKAALANHLSDDVGEVAVLPFTNPVFDKHLACIHVKTETSQPTRRQALKLYRETSHWHNHRKPLNPKHMPEVKVSKWRNPLRTNQFYMKEMTTYAASLTGAQGRVLEAETITVGSRKLAPATNDRPEKAGHSAKAIGVAENTVHAKKGSKKSAAGPTKADLIVGINKEKKGGQEAIKAFSAWSGAMKGFNAVVNDHERYLQAKSYLDGLDSTRSPLLELDINLYLLQALLSRWVKYCNADRKSDGYYTAALIWTVVRSICTSKVPLTKDGFKVVETVCTILSITDATHDIPKPTLDRKLSFTFNFPTPSPSLRIDMPQKEFQLMHCGPYMDRYLDAKPDPRVGFTPDGWQRKVLDELDADNSVFVVAPTSAGKTFISFYAMEMVLRGDDDSVLVYVAPTKALVNQIAAEIQGRFSKKYPRAGKSVWAIHTRDYRVNNATGCQILVTVPHVLQIMLLAPTNAKTWAPRVRRIIFDEIHSIGQAEDGVVWEQLLLLAPCPIIALSATIGNPTQFADWLAETQKASGTKLTMIQHSTRYSDLRKYLYKPRKTFKFEGLGKSKALGLGLDEISDLTFFHPIASLTDKSRGMPDDLALEPRDCFLLWKAMCKFQGNGYEVSKSLDPINALPTCIKKADIFKWEKELKAVLLKWMADRGSPFDQVVRELSPALGDVSNTEITSDDDIDNNEPDSIDPNDLCATTLPLLYQLHQRQALPAILFNYDRSGCEDIAQALLEQLKSAEARFKTGKEWQRKLDGWTAWKDLKDKKGGKRPVKVSKKKGGEGDDDKMSKADQARDDAESGATSYDLFDPEEPLDEYSFADKKRAQKSEIDAYVKQLRWKRVPEYLLELLQRGVGVHHAGMNRKYRQCVEMLFRKRYLRVVVATGTLSLGINMPCATVVFSGDSVFLTALNFRQAAGRSGRRGFDLLGNVIFQGMPAERASNLLSSRLPDIMGHFPITTTLVLRLFTLLSDSQNSPYAVKAINSLLSQPRLYLGGESFKEQVLHHLRFSIEYLRRQNLLGPTGQPVNWTSCVSHLYFTENSSFAFHALLKDGYFSKLCADIDTNQEEVLKTMMLTLSHLFGRQVCREVDDEETAEKIKRSPSMVFLPPMPDEAAAILRKHNATTLGIFTTYVKTFAAQHVKGEEHCLPLTQVHVGHQDATVNGNKKLDGVANGNYDVNKASFGALPTLATPAARSAFVALSGHGDDFATIEDLCTSTRQGVFLESAVIPHLELHPDESRTPLNAYLLDFFKHGALKPLEEANGIRRSDVWFVLNDFSLVLATIETSLANFLGLSAKGTDDDMLEIMGSGDAAENDEDEKEAADAVPVAATQPSLTQAPAVRRTKKNVADDWDADEDSMTAREETEAAEDVMVEDTDDEEYEKLMNVYRAFSKLKKEFDLKFREIWA